MKIKTSILLIAGFILLPAVLPAQTAAELEAVLGTQAVTCAQAAKFVLASIGSDSSFGQYSVSEQAAFIDAVGRGWLTNKSSSQDPITLGMLSYLIMEAFRIKGGLAYKFFKGPRYAYRTMVSRSYIRSISDPSMKVSGENFMLILGKVMDDYGGDN